MIHSNPHSRYIFWDSPSGRGSTCDYELRYSRTRIPSLRRNSVVRQSPARLEALWGVPSWWHSQRSYLGPGNRLIDRASRRGRKMQSNGRNVRPGDLGRTIASAMQEHLQKQLGSMKSQLEALRCDEHPKCRVIVESTSSGFQLSGSSCPEFKELVEEQLSNAGAKRTGES